MFRRNQTKSLHKRNKIKTRIISGYILVFGIFLGTFLLVQSETQASLQVTSKLQSLYTQIKENPGLDKLPGGDSMSNLYETALDTVKENNLLPIQEAMTQVTLDLNKQYNCQLLDSDITNILLSTDITLLKQLESLIIKDYKEDQEENIYIEYDDFKSSCDTLMQCKIGGDSTPPHLTCQETIYNAFIASQKNIQESYTMKSGIYGSNFFQNANEDDSIFDLLIDVEAIGNVLFEGFKSSESAQVLFYRMPERSEGGAGGGDVVEPGDPNFPDYPDANNDINRYDMGGGTYPEAGFQCPENIEAATETFDPPFINTGDINNGGFNIIDKDQTNQIYGENGEILEDGENTNNKQNNTTANYIDGVGTIGNACIDYEEEEIEPIIETGTITTGEIIPPSYECGNAIIEELEQCDDGNNDNTDNCLNTCIKNICGDGFLKDNHEQCDDGNLETGDGCNAICRLEESPYCGDGIIQIENGEQCDDGNNSNNDACLNTCKSAYCGDGYIQTKQEQCDDGNITSLDCCNSQCQNEGFLSPEDMALGDMLASFDKLSLNEGPEITESCFQNCEDLPISDRILCMVDCTCGEISSPAIGDAIDAGAFRLKYCMIPAESVEVISEGKTIFSIEEIFTAIKSLLLGLKDSGEMLKSVETKELMESSMMKNDFGKMFAFNIVFNFKSLNGGAKDDGVEKTKAIQQNENLMIGISALGDTESFPKQRNKYVMMADIATYKASQKDNKNIDDLQKEITAERENLNKKMSMAGINPGDPLSKETKMENNLANQRTARIAEEFMVFLDMNHAFWKNMNQMFEDMYSATALLRTKIEN